jgi:hypothetical protein
MRQNHTHRQMLKQDCRKAKSQPFLEKRRRGFEGYFFGGSLRLP